MSDARPADRSDLTAVITPVSGRAAHLARQREALAADRTKGIVHVVVDMSPEGGEVRPGAGPPAVVVHVAPGPHGLPLAAARNAGAAAALERGAGRLVFLDVDCLPGPGAIGAYARAVEREPATVWAGPVTYLPRGVLPAPQDLHHHDRPHPGRPAPDPGHVVREQDWRLFWSLSFAVHVDAWRRIGGFCEEYAGWGAEDTDLGQLARAAGLGLAWLGDARAYHQHHEPGARAAPGEVVRNAGVFHRRWGWWPMEDLLARMVDEGVLTRDDDGWHPVGTAPR